MLERLDKYGMARFMEWGWVAGWTEQQDLRRLVEAWLEDRLPHRIEVEHHENLTTEFVSGWLARNASGEAFAGILEGDAGPMVAHFEKAEDAVLFKMRFL